MCGIIGVTHSPEAAEEIFLGLQNLQHRGQDGGGIVTLYQGQFLEHRGLGLLDIAFPAENFQRLQGSTGIGHTRYTTTGKSDMALLQPFVSHEVGLAIAHNGNIVNFHSQRKSLRESYPGILGTGCDSELILWTLGHHLQETGSSPEGLLESVKRLAQSVVGSFSVVGLLNGVGLFAFRDPNGLRPLVMGERLNQEGRIIYAFASESTALEFLGYTNIQDVAPGEVVLVNEEGQLLRNVYTVPTPRHCMFEWVYFSRVESSLDELSVYQARFNLGVALASAVKAQGIKPDIVVPVPETSRIAAIALAEALDIPFREVLIKNRYVNRTFILESQEARQKAIHRKLYPIASELEDKKVLMVDDSIVRGNTAVKMVELLRRSGASEIYMASTCPPIQYPCYYGIDFPNREELLAGMYPLENLPDVLGVDALIYQSMSGLKTALKAEEMCTACLTGDYPTDVTEGLAFTQQRQLEREVHIS